MYLLRRPIRACDRILDIFYVISMEFLSLSRRRFSARNVPSGEGRGETDAVSQATHNYVQKNTVYISHLL